MVIIVGEASSLCPSSKYISNKISACEGCSEGAAPPVKCYSSMLSSCVLRRPMMMLAFSRGAYSK